MKSLVTESISISVLWRISPRQPEVFLYMWWIKGFTSCDSLLFSPSLQTFLPSPLQDCSLSGHVLSINSSELPPSCMSANICNKSLNSISLTVSSVFGSRPHRPSKPTLTHLVWCKSNSQVITVSVIFVVYHVNKLKVKWSLNSE